jgi:hypothetical protein
MAICLPNYPVNELIVVVVEPVDMWRNTIWEAGWYRYGGAGLHVSHRWDRTAKIFSPGCLGRREEKYLII